MSMSYEQFVETHGPQLYGSGVPQSLWKVVHEKASKEILDIGSNFQLAQISDEEEEEVSVEGLEALFKDPLPIEYNSAIPIETFDIIVTDECHRSIYNLWAQVLEYRNLRTSAYSLLRSLLGDFNLGQLVGAQYLLGIVMFSMFVAVAILVVLNVLMCVPRSRCLGTELIVTSKQAPTERHSP